MGLLELAPDRLEHIVKLCLRGHGLGEEKIEDYTRNDQGPCPTEHSRAKRSTSSPVLTATLWSPRAGMNLGWNTAGFQEMSAKPNPSLMRSRICEPVPRVALSDTANAQFLPVSGTILFFGRLAGCAGGQKTTKRSSR